MIAVTAKAALGWAAGWAIGVAGAVAYHLTNAEVTIVLSTIGATVPLGVAWITTRNKHPAPAPEPSAALRRSQDECRRLRAQLRELTRHLEEDRP